MSCWYLRTKLSLEWKNISFSDHLAVVKYKILKVATICKSATRALGQAIGSGYQPNSLLMLITKFPQTYKI